MSPEPIKAKSAPYPSVIDYVRVLRANRWLVLAVAAICGVIVLAMSVAQTPSYTTSAQLAVRDESQDLALIGTTEAPVTAAVLAAEYATNVLRPAVVASAAASLKLTPAELRSRVSVSVDPATNNVDVTARARTGASAARSANEVAQQDATITTNAQRAQLAAEALSLSKRAGASSAPGNSTARSVTAQRIADLYSLSSIVTPVSVQSSARVPGSPESPKPLRDTLIGLVIGVILGILISLLRTAVDGRLIDAEEISDLVGLPLLGNLADQSLGLGRDGADGRTRFNGQDMEAFRIIRQNAEFLTQSDGARGTSMLVASSTPGEGKTTVALGLALVSAAAGKRTLLVESDLRQPTLAGRLGVTSQPGLSEYLGEAAEAEEVVQSVNITSAADVSYDESPTFACIVAGAHNSEAADLLGSERFSQFLAEVSQVYDVVIVDSAPVLPVVDALEVAQHCDHLVMCVRAHQATRNEASSGKAALARVPSQILGVIITGVQKHDSGSYGYYSAYGSYASTVSSTASTAATAANGNGAVPERETVTS